MNDRDLLGLLDGLPRPRLLIVGDLILDRYVIGEVGRISPEAPIPILFARHAEDRLGGAGNVAANLRAMEAEVSVVGAVGDDPRGAVLEQLLAGIGVETCGLVATPGRPTTEKTRMVSGVQQMLRVDWEDPQPLSPAQGEAVVSAAVERLEGAGALVLSDYGKGVLTEDVLETLIGAARRRGLPILVDPKGRDYSRYRGATLLTPNRKEAEEALGRSLSRLDALGGAARELIERHGLEAAVITLGPDGIYVRSAGGRFGDLEARVPTVARAVFDVTGAGDTVIAHLALGLAAGMGLEGAVHLANHAAGLVVARRGAASVTREELRAALGQRRVGSRRIVTRAELPALLSEWRAEGKRIVFTNGCFDILHAGHVDYLRIARSRGDVLLVGVNDDASVRRLKGPGRPFNPLADRLEVLAALEMVDAVVPFGEDTPARIVEEVTPAVLVKGQDWESKGVVGREWVERHGGEVFLAPLLPERSTTSIAERVRAAGSLPGREHAPGPS